MVFMNLLYNNNYETTIEICLINNKKTSSKPLVETIFEPYLIFVTAKLGIYESMDVEERGPIRAYLYLMLNSYEPFYIANFTLRE